MWQCKRIFMFFGRMKPEGRNLDTWKITFFEKTHFCKQNFQVNFVNWTRKKIVIQGFLRIVWNFLGRLKIWYFFVNYVLFWGQWVKGKTCHKERTPNPQIYGKSFIQNSFSVTNLIYRITPFLRRKIPINFNSKSLWKKGLIF